MNRRGGGITTNLFLLLLLSSVVLSVYIPIGGLGFSCCCLSSPFIFKYIFILKERHLLLTMANKSEVVTSVSAGLSSGLLRNPRQQSKTLSLRREGSRLRKISAVTGLIAAVVLSFLIARCAFHLAASKQRGARRRLAEGGVGSPNR